MGKILSNFVTVLVVLVMAALFVVVIIATGKVKIYWMFDKKTVSEIRKPEDSGPASVNMANPASKFCVDNGYKSEIRTNPNGSQTGYCVFGNGKECPEWTYFRKECLPE